MTYAKSYEAKSNVSFELNYSGGDEYFQDSMRRAKHIFDNLELTMQEQYEGDAKKNRFKAFINAEAAIEDLKFSSDIWIDLDMQSNDPKYEIIVKIPAVVKPFLPEEHDKDYLYIDYLALAGEALSSDYAKSLYSSFDSGQIFDLLGLLDEMEGLGAGFVSSTTTEGNSTKLTLSLTDAQLKSLILSLLEEAKTNDAMLAYLTELYNAILAASASSAYTTTTAGAVTVAEMKALLTLYLDSNLPYIEKYFASTSILGEKGFVYEVVLGENDYIVKETVVIDICIDGGIAQSLYGGYSEDSEFIECIITAKSEYKKINKASSISLPELTGENSVDLAAATKQAEEERKEAAKYYFPSSYYYESPFLEADTPVELPLTGTYKGEQINSTIQLVKPTGNYYYGFYMPLAQVPELFGGEISLDEEMDTALWTVDGETMIFLTGDQTYDDDFFSSEPYEAITASSYSYDYEYGYNYDGTDFIPISSIEWFLDVDFGFDSDTNTILLK